MKKILLTGANGHLGQGMVMVLREHYSLRLTDVAPFTSDKHEVMVTDATDLDEARQAVKGMDGVVIAHMLSRTSERGAYREPPGPFDANVKSTANLFHAAVEEGIKDLVLISSCGVIVGHGRRPFYKHDLLPVPSRGYYTLTKICQEIIAEQYQRKYDLSVGVLRLGGIADADSMESKYGRKYTEFGLELIDRRDIGEAARLCLECKDLKYETFYVLGPKEAEAVYDTAYTKKRLGWQPQFDFAWMKKPGGLKPYFEDRIK